MSVGVNIWNVCACLNANERVAQLLQARKDHFKLYKLLDLTYG